MWSNTCTIITVTPSDTFQLLRISHSIFIYLVYTLTKFQMVFQCKTLCWRVSKNGFLSRKFKFGWTSRRKKKFALFTELCKTLRVLRDYINVHYTKEGHSKSIQHVDATRSLDRSVTTIHVQLRTKIPRPFKVRNWVVAIGWRDVQRFPIRIQIFPVNVLVALRGKFHLLTLLLAPSHGATSCI